MKLRQSESFRCEMGGERVTRRVLQVTSVMRKGYRARASGCRMW